MSPTAIAAHRTSHDAAPAQRSRLAGGLHLDAAAHRAALQGTLPVWGKLPGSYRPVPLYRHLVDTMVQAGSVWQSRPQSIRRRLAAAFGSGPDDQWTARTRIVVAAGLHDLGKATPWWQVQQLADGSLPALVLDGVRWRLTQAGLPLDAVDAAWGPAARRLIARHELVGQHLLTRGGIVAAFERGDGAPWIGQVVAGHHPGAADARGRSQDAADVAAAAIDAVLAEPWRRQHRLMIDAVLSVAGSSADALEATTDDTEAIHLATAVVIEADHAASNGADTAPRAL